VKILITGITGFVGSHLADFLIKKNNCEVYGIDRPNSNETNINNFKKHIKLFKCDITDFQSVKSIIQDIKPVNIFHLAAIGAGPDSFTNPREILYNNIMGTLNILESLKNTGIKAKTLISGSSEEYGMVTKQEVPVYETNQLRPFNPYAVSKASQTLLGYQYANNFSMEIVLTRAFNHTGPRQSENFVCSSFAKQIAEIEIGLKKPVIYVGNLNTAKDFTDVRDIVKAYWLAMEKGKTGEVYNICSGGTSKIEDILDILLSLSENKNIEIKNDPNLLRPSEVPNIWGNCDKFKTLTGWEPANTINQTLFDLLNYWRQIYSREKN